MKTQREILDRFIKIFESIIYRFKPYEVFNDFLSLAICCFSLGTEEEEYHQIRLKYKPEEFNMFPEMLGCLMQYVILGTDENEPSDLLGDLYMELASRYHASAMGQFFTPMGLCKMMSTFTMTETDPNKPIIGSDPAVGSGRCILSSYMVHKNSMWIGADKDFICVKMTIINMYLHGMVFSEVQHMDTLSLEWYRGYRIGLKESFIDGQQVFAPQIIKIKKEEMLINFQASKYFFAIYEHKANEYNQELEKLNRLKKAFSLIMDLTPDEKVLLGEPKEKEIPERDLSTLNYPVNKKVHRGEPINVEVEIKKVFDTFSKSIKDKKLQEVGQVSLFDF